MADNCETTVVQGIADDKLAWERTNKSFRGYGDSVRKAVIDLLYKSAEDLNRDELNLARAYIDDFRGAARHLDLILSEEIARRDS